MTDAQKRAMVKSIIGENPTDSEVDVYLNLSYDKIMSRLYPFGAPDEAVVPLRYDILHCELASRMWLRKGGEGEMTHSENGVSRTYHSVDDKDILERIVPYAKVM